MGLHAAIHAPSFPQPTTTTRSEDDTNSGGQVNGHAEMAALGLYSRGRQRCAKGTAPYLSLQNVFSIAVSQNGQTRHHYRSPGATTNGGIWTQPPDVTGEHLSRSGVSRTWCSSGGSGPRRELCSSFSLFSHRCFSHLDISFRSSVPPPHYRLSYLAVTCTR